VVAHGVTTEGVCGIGNRPNLGATSTEERHDLLFAESLTEFHSSQRLADRAVEFP